MASMDMAQPEPIGRIEDGMVVKLFCCAFGAVMAIFGDLMNNERASLLIKLREVLKTYAHPQFEDTYVVILFVVAIALCLFVVRPPRGRGEAFAQGLAVFAVFTTLAPFKAIPYSSEINLSAAHPPAASSLLFGTAIAAPSAETFRRSVVVVFEGGRAPSPGARVIVRDAATGAPVGQRSLAEARSDVTIAAPRGFYLLDVEADGFERTRARVQIAGPADLPATIQVRRSSVPLPIQQLWRPNAVKPR